MHTRFFPRKTATQEDYEQALSLGLALLALAFFTGGAVVKEPTGNLSADVANYIYDLFEKRGGGLGMLIMILIGFSAYMSHVGANDVVIRVLYKPLRHIRSPYMIMAGGYILGCMMSFAIHSATALGVFLMATLFPIMVRIGISVPSAAAVCASTTAVNLAPTAADVVLAAEKAGAPLIHFSFNIILPMSLVALVFITIAHFFWQRWCDKREGLLGNGNTAVEVQEAQVPQSDAPLAYFLLPFLPIVLLFIFTQDGAGVLEKINVRLFDAEKFPEITLGGLIVLTVIITALCEFVRHRKAAPVYDGLEVCYRGMGEAFSGVVVLLIAAGVFAHGLSSIGFVSALIDSVQQVGNAANLVMIALVVITLLVAIAAGSGNAAFFAFVEIAPRLAGEMGLNPAYLIAPMMQVSNTGRVMSPVSGVMVAVSGAAKISPLLLAKRTSVPALVGVVVIVVYTMLFIPK
ncbi:MAG: anaerobic C4-dicarboxylate transporter DcuC [Cardiobacteriaceae bacterium]|nr:anaerobic C4-dicarboxylate transporter DcuC [Cardiobacteriaceae bacterium]